MIPYPDVPGIPVVPDVPEIPVVPDVPCDPVNCGDPCDPVNCGDPVNCDDPLNCDGPDPDDVMKIYCFPGILTLEVLFEVVRLAVFSALLDILPKLAGEVGD